MNIRINKFLADAGVASRREADRLVEDGLVEVDGVKAVAGQKIVGNEHVTVKGELVAIPDRRHYILYHKPIGVMTTTDRSVKDNMMDRIEKAAGTLPKARLFPVGRLDVASSGLIMLTDDAEVATALARPEGGHEKVYLVEVERPLTEKDITALRAGVPVLGRKTRPAKVRKFSETMFEITLTEGRNRQIRRMCEAINHEVVRLGRVGILDLTLDGLKPGQWRELTDREVEKLKKDLGL